jgi:hypothetical protein
VWIGSWFVCIHANQGEGSLSLSDVRDSLRLKCSTRENTLQFFSGWDIRELYFIFGQGKNPAQVIQVM